MNDKIEPSKKGNIQKHDTIDTEKDAAINAHRQAEADLSNDPELKIAPEKGDDLDEGELARLEGED